LLKERRGLVKINEAYLLSPLDRKKGEEETAVTNVSRRPMLSHRGKGVVAVLPLKGSSRRTFPQEKEKGDPNE